MEENNTLGNRYYIVNTNLSWHSQAYREMLDNNKAAAYRSRRHDILKIKQFDTVFIYHNKVGIIAYGKVQEKPHCEDDNDKYWTECYVPLKFEWNTDPDTQPYRAVTARQIHEEIDPKMIFRHTVFSITSNTADAIKKLAELNDKRDK